MSDETCKTHCCPRHGCKYGGRCVVENGQSDPKYPRNNGCEQCESEMPYINEMDMAPDNEDWHVYRTKTGMPIEIKIFRVYESEYSNQVDSIFMERYYKSPPHDAVAAWIRLRTEQNNRPRPGTYLFFAPENECGETPVAAKYTISYPEFMISHPRHGAREITEYEHYFEGEQFGHRSRDR